MSGGYITGSQWFVNKSKNVNGEKFVVKSDKLRETFRYSIRCRLQTPPQTVFACFECALKRWAIKELLPKSHTLLMCQLLTIGIML